MLAVDFFARPGFQSLPPMHRSPLGARDANTCSWSPLATSMSNTDKTIKTRPSEPRKREGKFAPLLRKKDDRDLRRNAYLTRGKNASDEKRFEARAEQSQRLQWLEERRQWEAQMAAEREASQIEVDPDLDGEEISCETPDSTLGNVHDNHSMMAPPDDDEVLQYYMSSQQHQDHDMDLPDLSQAHSQHKSSQQMEFWSDDDEFEKSLLEAAMEIERAPDWGGNVSQTAGQEDMDVSMG